MRFDVAEPELDRVVTIALFVFHLQNNARPGAHDGDRLSDALLAENEGHSHLGTKQCGYHAKSPIPFAADERVRSIPPRAIQLTRLSLFKRVTDTNQDRRGGLAPLLNHSRYALIFTKTPAGT